MQKTFITDVIVLKRVPFRERDSRVIVYSEDQGLMVLIARGTRDLGSKMAGHLEPLTRTRIMVVKGKRFDYIGSAVNLSAWPGIKSNFEKTAAVGKAIAFFLRFIKEGVSDEILFAWLIKYFDSLENMAAEALDPSLPASLVILKILSRLGYKPDLGHCAVCRRPVESAAYYFDPGQGGLVCPAHKKGGQNTAYLSIDTINLLKSAINNDICTFTKISSTKKTAQEAIKVIAIYMDYIQ